MAKNTFPDKPYVSLEDPDVRLQAEEDPRRFLSRYPGGAIIDEAQKAPEILSYIQTLVDELSSPGFFILTGSQNFLLSERISQSLAGRASIHHLLPLAFEEINAASLAPSSVEDLLFKGGFPSIYDRSISPVDFFPSYIQTYIERDVRQIKNITDLSMFQKFLLLCAGRIGGILNLSALANDCGISHNTARAWLSILEASYIIFLLQPYHKNFNKRLVKSPKLYFYDSGLACNLLGIENLRQLESHFALGGIFESWVVSEIVKHRANRGLRPNCFYWRNNTGNEIDIIIDTGGSTTAIEIKAAKTVNSDFFKGLLYWQKLAQDADGKSYLFYAGDTSAEQKPGHVFGWKDIDQALGKIYN